MSKNTLRNVAIIAHVDHGKTTLVDQLLTQSGTLERQFQSEKRVMDSNDLEKERGITILAKCTSISWEDFTFNIVDTPGHADFGGEVERILGMVDGVLLLVDAAEGVMPQTKFVLTKALEQKLRPIVVINKMDRPDSRYDAVLEEVFDLFLHLNATEEQLDFPTLYASAKNGWATSDPDTASDNMTCIFEAIRDCVNPPKGDVEAPFQFLATMMDSDPYLGRILTGKIYNGRAKVNMPVHALNREGKVVEQGRITKISVSRGLTPHYVDTAEVGQIISIAGLTDATVSDTITPIDCTTALASQPIDPPTIAMSFSINDSPLAGQDGKKLTSRVIRDRLMKEMERNISIKISETEQKDIFEVAGRGELQLGILIENMRREGFELSISRPRVLFKQDENGNRLEPIEEVKIDVDEEFVGTVVEHLGKRRGEMKDMQPLDGNRTRITFSCPSRGLIGFRNELLTDTRGTAVMHRSFEGYGPFKGEIEKRRNGSLISNGDGKALAYALWNLEERGVLFINPSDMVYEGMIIGQHSRGNDLDVNPLKGKKLTNVRASGKDEGIRLTPPTIMTLEKAISYIEADELIEVTPQHVRLRKKYLNPHERKRFAKSGNMDG